MPIATKLDSMVTYHEELSPINSHTFLSRGLAGSCDKLKPLYLRYYDACSHKIWQDGDLT